MTTTRRWAATVSLLVLVAGVSPARAHGPDEPYVVAPVALGEPVTVLLPDSALHEITWGDGTSTTVPAGDRQARHTYAQSGVYRVTYRATGNDGGGRGGDVELQDFPGAVVHDPRRSVTGRVVVPYPAHSTCFGCPAGSATVETTSAYRRGEPAGSLRVRTSDGDTYTGRHLRWIAGTAGDVTLQASGLADDGYRIEITVRLRDGAGGSVGPGVTSTDRVRVTVEYAGVVSLLDTDREATGDQRHLTAVPRQEAQGQPIVR